MLLATPPIAAECKRICQRCILDADALPDIYLSYLRDELTRILETREREREIEASYGQGFAEALKEIET